MTADRMPPAAGATTNELARAARMGFVDEVRALLARGVSPNRPTVDGVPPLLAARAAGFADIANLLVAHGAVDVTGPDTLRDCAQLDGQDRYDIQPTSETDFRWLVVDAQITFVREGGRVTHAVHTQH